MTLSIHCYTGQLCVQTNLMFLYLMRVQVFSEHMNKMEAPQITNCERGLNWTKATFKPDLTKFKMTNLDEDDVALMRRVIDIAATFGETVDVKLDGNCVPVRSFLQYVKLYIQSDEFPRTVKVS